MLFQNFSSHLLRPVENDQSTMVGNGTTSKRASPDPNSPVLQHAKVINKGEKEHTRAFCNWLAQLSVALEGATSAGMSIEQQEFHKVGAAWRGANLQDQNKLPSSCHTSYLC
ncbi:hypothetical protein AMTRI_Chr02g264670 [Amborella trichopoda]